MLSLGDLLKKPNSTAQVYSKAYALTVLKDGFRLFLHENNLPEDLFQFNVVIKNQSVELFEIIISSQNNQFLSWLKINQIDLNLFLESVLQQKNLLKQEGKVVTKLKPN